VLAKEPQMAEKWLRKGKWFPDREVRKWLEEVRGDSDETVDHYRTYYSRMSAWAHPTLVSCFDLIIADEKRFAILTGTRLNEDGLRNCIKQIAVTAIFACFAVRNSAVNEEVIDPNWRRDLSKLAREVLEHEMPNLDRDWEDEQRKHDAFQQRVQAADQLEQRLREQPASWRNTKP
jgi:hypothetical protein